jgi:hypothetical protein
VSNWLDELDDDGRREWDEYVTHFRQNVLHEIVGANVFASIVPKDDGDPKFWMELGAAIMFDKPLVALAMPGAKVPEKLRRVCDRIVYADIDTEEGREYAMRAFAQAMKELGVPDEKED